MAIKWKSNGKTHESRRGYGSAVYQEIDKDEYDRLEKLPLAERRAEILAGLSESLILGYGASAEDIVQMSDGYFAGYHCYDSCD